MERELESIIAEVLEIPVDQIDDSSTMENIDSWDSLRHMELVLAIEQRFKVEFTAEELLELSGVKEIKQMLGTKAIQS